MLTGQVLVVKPRILKVIKWRCNAFLRNATQTQPSSRTRLSSPRYYPAIKFKATRTLFIKLSDGVDNILLISDMGFLVGQFVLWTHEQ